MGPAIADLLYLAGLFDGEGHVNIRKAFVKKTNGKKYAHWQGAVGISNTNLPIILWAQRLFPNVTSHLRKKPRTKNELERLERFAINHKDLYTLTWVGPSAREVLRYLCPLLRIKRSEAEITLKFLATFRGRPGVKGYPPEIFEEREVCMSEFRAERSKEATNESV